MELAFLLTSSRGQRIVEWHTEHDPTGASALVASFLQLCLFKFQNTSAVLNG